MIAHRLRISAAVVLVFGVANSALAGPLAPRKASQVVVLRDSGAPCVNAIGKLLDGRILSDGTTGPLTIPPGQVLVLTGVEATIVGAPASSNRSLFLIYDTPLQAPLFSAGFLADAAGTAGVNASIPNVVVKAGTGICVNPNAGFTIVVTVHGFFAKDN